MIAGCSVKAVERRLSRARELLKKSLASHLSV
jgi:DNA-directed RNA polymerase specialized sigma24 family protein